MKFATVSFTLATAISSVLAALNEFSTPTKGAILKAGDTFVVNWNNTNAAKTIDILLQKGPADNLKTALTIATGLTNQGAVNWHIPADLVSGTDYFLEIKDNGSGEITYSPQFTIDGVAATSSASASGSTSGAVAGGASGSTSAAASGSATSASESASASASESASSAASSASGAASSASEAASSASGAASSASASASSAASAASSAASVASSASGAASSASASASHASASASHASESASASGSAAASSSKAANGASIVSYSSVLAAGAIAGVVFMAL